MEIMIFLNKCPLKYNKDELHVLQLCFVIPNCLKLSLRPNETAVSWDLCDGLITKQHNVFCKLSQLWKVQRSTEVEGKKMK